MTVHRITFTQMKCNPNLAAELSRSGGVEVVDDDTGERRIYFRRITLDPTDGDTNTMTAMKEMNGESPSPQGNIEPVIKYRWFSVSLITESHGIMPTDILARNHDDALNTTLRNFFGNYKGPHRELFGARVQLPDSVHTQARAREYTKMYLLQAKINRGIHGENDAEMLDNIYRRQTADPEFHKWVMKHEHEKKVFTYEVKIYKGAAFDDMVARVQEEFEKSPLETLPSATVTVQEVRRNTCEYKVAKSLDSNRVLAQILQGQMHLLQLDNDRKLQVEFNGEPLDVEAFLSWMEENVEERWPSDKEGPLGKWEGVGELGVSRQMMAPQADVYGGEYEGL